MWILKPMCSLYARYPPVRTPCTPGAQQASLANMETFSEATFSLTSHMLGPYNRTSPAQLTQLPELSEHRVPPPSRFSWVQNLSPLPMAY